eukprot:scaffold94651_cov33-Tisochrysis_lutea.AAC.1
MGVDPIAEARRRRKEARAPKSLGYSAPPPALKHTPISLPPPLPPPLPPSVTYIPEFIDEEDEALLLMHVEQAPPERWSGGATDGRRTQNYGGAPGSLAVAEGLPDWLSPLVQAVVDSGAWGNVPPPNHILINVFRPGAGLVPHTDGPMYAGPRVATLSLGSDVMLRVSSSHVNDSSHPPHTLHELIKGLADILKLR